MPDPGTASTAGGEAAGYWVPAHLLGALVPLLHAAGGALHGSAGGVGKPGPGLPLAAPAEPSFLFLAWTSSPQRMPAVVHLPRPALLTRHMKNPLSALSSAAAAASWAAAFTVAPAPRALSAALLAAPLTAPLASSAAWRVASAASLAAEDARSAARPAALSARAAAPLASPFASLVCQGGRHRRILC